MPSLHLPSVLGADGHHLVRLLSKLSQLLLHRGKLTLQSLLGGRVEEGAGRKGRKLGRCRCINYKKSPRKLEADLSQNIQFHNITSTCKVQLCPRQRQPLNHEKHFIFVSVMITDTVNIVRNT